MGTEATERLIFLIDQVERCSSTARECAAEARVLPQGERDGRDDAKAFRSTRRRRRRRLARPVVDSSTARVLWRGRTHPAVAARRLVLLADHDQHGAAGDRSIVAARLRQFGLSCCN